MGWESAGEGVSAARLGPPFSHSVRQMANLVIVLLGQLHRLVGRVLWGGEKLRGGNRKLFLKIDQQAGTFCLLNNRPSFKPGSCDTSVTINNKKLCWEGLA